MSPAVAPLPESHAQRTPGWWATAAFVDVALLQVERAPELVRNDVPEALNQLIAASLSADPRERPASGGALASAVRQVPFGD